MKTGLIICFCCRLLWFFPGLAAASDKKVDETIVRYADLTGDGAPEKVELHLMAKSIKSSFRWTIKISSKDKTIYSIERNDEWLDQFFNEKNFVYGCDGYEKCKREYYFEELLRIVIPPNLYDERAIMGDSGIGSIWEVGGKFLVSERHLNKAAADKILASVLERYRNKLLPLISVHISPVKGDSPMIYVEEIEGFMPVYRE